MKALALLVAVCALLLAPARPAHAYLDPQTGSMIISAIVAFLATIAMGLRSYWHKLLGLFRGRPRETPEPTEARERESGRH